MERPTSEETEGQMLARVAGEQRAMLPQYWLVERTTRQDWGLCLSKTSAFDVDTTAPTLLQFHFAAAKRE
ncbi:MAG: unnamed protein product [uncultured Paraburkholderia sp.]|nr:MAG: unnamed protein product [uncultured Paraburkholderia sp.]CAH2934495.1 MAG: unnamed protein product [uncultured Paraburkholderia sp.]